MGDMADYLTEQGMDQLAMHDAGMCDGPCQECETECETCQGDGRVLDYNKFTLDKGKWMRSFEETISMECPDCDGTGKAT